MTNQAQVQSENEAAVEPLASRLKDAGMQSGTFQVRDREGIDWRITMERLA